MEYYLELYSRENIVTSAALVTVESLPVLEELDEQPTETELGDAIDCLANGKARGNDSIPPKIIKCAESALLPTIHELLCLCW